MSHPDFSARGYYNYLHRTSIAMRNHTDRHEDVIMGRVPRTPTPMPSPVRSYTSTLSSQAFKSKSRPAPTQPRPTMSAHEALLQLIAKRRQPPRPPAPPSAREYSTSTIRCAQSSPSSLTSSSFSSSSPSLPLSNYNLSSLTALIIGGSSGVGYAIAQELALQGVRVVVTSRSLDRAVQAAKQMDETIGSAHQPSAERACTPVLGLACDVRQSADLDAAVQSALKHFEGRLDIVVHAAGIHQDALIARAKDESVSWTQYKR